MCVRPVEREKRREEGRRERESRERGIADSGRRGNHKAKRGRAARLGGLLFHFVCSSAAGPWMSTTTASSSSSGVEESSLCRSISRSSPTAHHPLPSHLRHVCHKTPAERRDQEGIHRQTGTTPQEQPLSWIGFASNHLPCMISELVSETLETLLATYFSALNIVRNLQKRDPKEAYLSAD